MAMQTLSLPSYLFSLSFCLSLSSLSLSVYVYVYIYVLDIHRKKRLNRSCLVSFLYEKGKRASFVINQNMGGVKNAIIIKQFSFSSSFFPLCLSFCFVCRVVVCVCVREREVMGGVKMQLL